MERTKEQKRMKYYSWIIKNSFFETEMNHLNCTIFYIFVEFFIRRIPRKLQSVEACMALGIGICRIVWHLFYMELLILPPVAF